MHYIRSSITDRQAGVYPATPAGEYSPPEKFNSPNQALLTPP